MFQGQYLELGLGFLLEYSMLRVLRCDLHLKAKVLLA